MLDTMINEYELAGVDNEEYQEALHLQKLERYAQLKIQQEKIETELKELKAEVSSFVNQQDNELVETSWGKFELRAGRKTWKYSDELLLQEQQALEALKHKKKQEELSGKAELVKAPTNLVFTIKKV